MPDGSRAAERRRIDGRLGWPGTELVGARFFIASIFAVAAVEGAIVRASHIRWTVSAAILFPGVIQLGEAALPGMFGRLPGTDRITPVIALALVACLNGRAAQDPAPDPDEQQRLLQAMGTYAQQYIKNLPNFVCEQVTRQYEAGRKPKNWHKGDSLTFKLLFTDGEEQRKLELVNDKPVGLATRRWRAPLTTTGEFGILLGNVFSGASDASFRWNRWEVINGRRIAVFDYSIDAAHSTVELSLSDLAKAVVPYHGSVYGDVATGAVWRVEDAMEKLPKRLDTESIFTVIEYDAVPIGGKTYLLPLHASTWLKTSAGNVRNELEFQHYQKFETDSAIKYASVDGSEGSGGSPQY